MSAHFRLYQTLLIVVLGFAGFAIPASAQEVSKFSDVAPAADHPDRTQIIEPFRIIDNIYSVSAVVHDPVFLITTSEGHMLIDTSYEKFVPAVVRNIEKLGFKTEDIKYLLAAHAHNDHIGGHAMMKEISGATLLAPAVEVDVYESGGKTDFRDGALWTPVKVDRTFEDLEQLRLGDTVLTAHLTPGHTKGCTTWTMVAEENGKKYNVLFFGGMRMNTGEPLMNNPDYPEMAADFAYSFAKLKVLPVDVYLSSHGYWFDLADKIKRLAQKPSTNPFIDPEGYQRTLERFEGAYLEALKAERGITAP